MVRYPDLLSMEMRIDGIGAAFVSTRWKHWFAQTVGLLAIVSTVAAFAQSRLESSTAVGTLKSGEYLSEKYVDRLKETHSPFRAYMTGPPQLVILEQQRDETHLMPIFNFHEGGPEIAVGKNGKVSVTVDAGLKVGNPIVSSSGLGQLLLGFGDFHPQRFVFVGKASTYVAKVVLVGRYMDGLNRSYEFQNNGRAVFPDHQFSYSVGIDHVVNKFDYFVDDDTGKIYGYRVDGASLCVYGTTGELGQVEDKIPQLVLKRVVGEKD